MNHSLRKDAEAIVRAAIDAVKPDAAVRRALSRLRLDGRVFLVSVGKAGWQMADAAVRELPHPIERGIVVTKYEHVMGAIPNVTCCEAGHPVPDENSFRAAQAVLDMTAKLRASDTVLFLLSGGGSALFEKPLIEPEELREITRQLLACGADIVEMNTIRKRLSAVKGGRFARWCAPARVEAVVLSDILGDPLDMIASGPAAAEAACRDLGYEPVYLTDRLDCEAREAGRFLASILRAHASSGRRLAFLAGGETVVHLTGNGLGGRNQELALAAAETLRGLPNAALISVGSDGTDGPTDAAGGYVDGESYDALAAQGIGFDEALQNNDAYHALHAIGGLIKTGPTGTNVNDVAVALLNG